MQKYTCEIVRDFDNSYYANICVDGTLVTGLPEYVDYRTLRKAVKEDLDIDLPKMKDLSFSKPAFSRKSYAVTEGECEIENTRFASREKQREDILKSLKTRGFSYAFLNIDDKLKHDRNFLIEAINANHNMFMVVPESIKHYDPDVVLAALKGNGYHLQECPYEIQNDIRFVLEAYKSNPESLQFTSKTIRYCIEDHIAKGTLDELYNNPPKNLYMPKELNLIRDYMNEHCHSCSISDYRVGTDGYASVTLNTKCFYGWSSLELEFEKDDYKSFLEAFYDIGDGHNYMDEPDETDIGIGECILYDYDIVKSYMEQAPVFGLTNVVENSAPAKSSLDDLIKDAESSTTTHISEKTHNSREER